MSDAVEVGVAYLTEAHDGPGWYWWEEECREEGCCGAFPTREDAEAHAKDAYGSCPHFRRYTEESGDVQ